MTLSKISRDGKSRNNLTLDNSGGGGIDEKKIVNANKMIAPN